ncbi:MAG: hypothetical protein K2J24_07175 [Muribaculaceae bacterium]|nr:hypothetical protein [Muribaculaceae bacterium]
MAHRSLSSQEKQTSSQSSAEVAERLEYLSADQLRNLTTDRLVTLYFQFPERVEVRITAGREHFTCFFESRIISELSGRIPVDAREQAAIDSCLSSHRSELANMAAVLDLPLSGSAPFTASSDILAPDPTRHYTSDELIALLHLYTPCRDLTERERLVEYVDYSLNLLATSSDPQTLANLAAELAELDRRHIVRCPRWLRIYLTDAISRWFNSPTVPDTDMVLPLLTASLLNLTVTPPHHRPISPPSLERRAQRIINRCYRTALYPHSLINYTQLSSLILFLYITFTYSTYVTRFSIRRLISVWNICCSEFLILNLESSLDNVIFTSTHIFTHNFIFPTITIISLLEIADGLFDFVSISYDLKFRLTKLIEERAKRHDLVAEIYLKTVEIFNYNHTVSDIKLIV